MQNIIDLCRALRQQETPAEKLLWQYLRNRQLDGYKFLRQHPICVSAFGMNRYYIPDFYCHEAKLVIEADGPIHLLKKEYDKNRDDVLVSFKLKIIRFKNDEILNDLEGTLKQIKAFLNK